MKRLYIIIWMIWPWMLWSQNLSQISGFVYNQNQTEDAPSFIEIAVYEFTSGSEQIYIAPLEEDGTFSLTYFQEYAQDIKVRYGKREQSIFVNPQNSLLITLDAQAFLHNAAGTYPLDFMGSEASLNYEIQSYLHEYERLPYHDEHRILRKEPDPELYKRYRLDLLEKEKLHLSSYISRAKSDTQFVEWAKLMLDYRCANDLMRYRWINPVLNGAQLAEDRPLLEESYFDFTNIFLTENDTATIQSFYGRYLVEYSQYIKEYKQEKTESGRFSDYVVLVSETATTLSDEDKNRLYVIANTSQNSLSTEDKGFLREIIARDSSVQRSIAAQEALDEIKPFLQLEAGIVKDATLTWHIHDLIRKFDHTAASALRPVLQEHVSRPELKDRVEFQFAEMEKLLNQPEIPEDTRLSYLYGQSGDTLLKQMLEPYKGKVVYINFWATWSEPCNEQWRPMQMLETHFREEPDVVFLHIALNSPEEIWKAMIAREGLKGNHYWLDIDQTKVLAQYLRLTQVPKYFLVSSTGRIVTRRAKRPSTRNRLREDLEKLLGMKLAQDHQN